MNIPAQNGISHKQVNLATCRRTCYTRPLWNNTKFLIQRTEKWLRYRVRCTISFLSLLSLTKAQLELQSLVSDFCYNQTLWAINVGLNFVCGNKIFYDVRHCCLRVYEKRFKLLWVLTEEAFTSTVRRKSLWIFFFSGVAKKLQYFLLKVLSAFNRAALQFWPNIVHQITYFIIAIMYVFMALCVLYIAAALRRQY